MAASPGSIPSGSPAASGGGYCFAPTHLIQDNSPLENVLEMYRCAREFGRC